MATLFGGIGVVQVLIAGAASAVTALLIAYAVIAWLSL